MQLITHSQIGMATNTSWESLRTALRVGVILWSGCGCLARALRRRRRQRLPKAHKVDFNREVRPILAKNCFACHGQDEAKRAKGLRLDRRESAVKPLKSGETAIVPGDPDSSELIVRVTEEDETLRMPPRKTGNRLTPAEVDVLQRWIEQGAEYAPHWALIAPEAAAASRGPRHGMAAQRHRLLDPRPAGEGGPQTLARGRPAIRCCAASAWTSAACRPRPKKSSASSRIRPPTPTRGPSTAFSTTRPTASAGRGCGSTWPAMPIRPATARTRSGPTSGDIATGSSSAFNRNLPFDQFTLEQIAGDLLPNPTLEERIATAFHRNTMTNTEGGTDDEEFRVAAIKDRVDTTMQVWMGLTMGCAKCHSHKFDPITHEEYYQFYAFFNQTADNDQPDESPVIPAPTAEIAERVQQIDAQIAALRQELETPTPRWPPRRPSGNRAWLRRRGRAEGRAQGGSGDRRHPGREADQAADSRHWRGISVRSRRS